jgi:hypothetical protein
MTICGGGTFTAAQLAVLGGALFALSYTPASGASGVYQYDKPSTCWLADGIGTPPGLASSWAYSLSGVSQSNTSSLPQLIATDTSGKIWTWSL